VGAYALLTLTALCWAGNHIAGRWIAVETPPVPPAALSVVRWLLATLVLLPLSWRHIARDWQALAQKPGIVVFLGLLGGAGFTVLQYYGLRYTTAVNVSVMNSVGPAFIILAGVIIFRDYVGRAQLGGIAVSLVGVLVILARGEPAALLDLGFNFGDVLVLVNMGIFAVYSACLRLRPPLHSLTFMTLMSALASLGSLPVAAVEALSGEVLRATWTTAVVVIYTGLFTSVAAYLAWNAGVARLGVQRAGVFLHLVPLFGALLSIVLLGEEPRPFHAVGLLLIIAGVTIAAGRHAPGR
jgi:drug/metabolite transporter (DMT)-like permease